MFSLIGMPVPPGTNQFILFKWTSIISYYNVWRKCPCTLTLACLHCNFFRHLHMLLHNTHRSHPRQFDSTYSIDKDMINDITGLQTLAESLSAKHSGEFCKQCHQLFKLHADKLSSLWLLTKSKCEKLNLLYFYKLSKWKSDTYMQSTGIKYLTTCFIKLLLSTTVAGLLGSSLISLTLEHRHSSTHNSGRWIFSYIYTSEMFE